MASSRTAASARYRIKCFALALAVVTASAASARAESVLPPKSQANILARVLAYDRNLKARAGDSVVVGVVYAPSSSASTAEAEEIFTTFKSLEKFVLLGLPLKVEKVAFTDAAMLKATIKERGIDALFVCSALDADLAAIIATARELDTITLTGQRRYVSQGIAIGSVVIDGKPALVFNRAASEAEGSQFSSQFLSLTTSIDDG